MTRKLVLEEGQPLAKLVVEGGDLARQTIILERDGQEIAAIIPIDRYRSFEVWEQQQEKRPPQDLEFEAEKAAFERLEPALMADYQGKYVAIRGGQVVDSDKNKLALIIRVYNTLGYGPMYVHKVGEPAPDRLFEPTTSNRGPAGDIRTDS